MQPFLCSRRLQSSLAPLLQNTTARLLFQQKMQLDPTPCFKKIPGRRSKHPDLKLSLIQKIAHGTDFYEFPNLTNPYNSTRSPWSLTVLHLTITNHWSPFLDFANTCTEACSKRESYQTISAPSRAHKRKTLLSYSKLTQQSILEGVPSKSIWESPHQTIYKTPQHSQLSLVKQSQNTSFP